jgi:CRP-like cAMP-binding protein
MTEQLIAHMKRRVPLSATDVETISSQFVPRSIKKNDHVFLAGQICAYGSYVVKGAFRYYHANEHLDEYTTRFAFEDWWIGDLDSLFSQTPAALSLQALEDSELLCIDKKGYAFLFENSPVFNELFRINRNRGFNKLNQLMIDKMSKTAEERYLDLLKQHPQIFQRVALKHIASFLGIKPESLSRIRKNITP